MNIIDKYDMQPVLLIFCVQDIQPASLREKLIKHPAKPWSLKYPGHQLWTKDCLLMAPCNLSYHDQGLPDPVVSIASFFSAKQPTLANHEHSDDNTVQKMYALAKSYSMRHGEYQQNFCTTMESFCTTSEKLWESTQRHVNNIPGNTTKATKAITRGLEHVRAFKRQCSEMMDDDDDSSSGSPPPLPPKLRITDKAKTKTDDTEDDELAFAISYQQSYRKKHGSKRSWQACFEAGRERGLFMKYGNNESLRVQAVKYKNQT